MRKQVSILLILTIFMFVFSGCVLQQSKQNQEANEQNEKKDSQELEAGNLAEPENIQQELEKFNELEAKEKFSAEECESIIDDWTKEQCLNEGYKRNAMDNNDISLCEKINDESVRNNCKISVEEFNSEINNLELPVSDGATN